MILVLAQAPYTMLQGLCTFHSPPQAVPAIEFHSEVPCTAAAFAGRCIGPAPLAAELPATDAADAACAAGAEATGGATGWPRLAAGYADGCVRVFDVARRAIIWGVVRHPSPVVALVSSAVNPLVLSASI
mgnify:CR=1 FL=1